MTKKAIDKVLAEAQAKIDAAQTLLEEARDMVEEAKDEQRETFDNLPENFQTTERGQTAEARADKLDDVYDAFNTLIDSTDWEIDMEVE